LPEVAALEDYRNFLEGMPRVGSRFLRRSPLVILSACGLLSLAQNFIQFPENLHQILAVWLSFVRPLMAISFGWIPTYFNLPFPDYAKDYISFGLICSGAFLRSQMFLKEVEINYPIKYYTKKIEENKNNGLEAENLDDVEVSKIKNKIERYKKEKSDFNNSSYYNFIKFLISAIFWPLFFVTSLHYMIFYYIKKIKEQVMFYLRKESEKPESIEEKIISLYQKSSTYFEVNDEDAAIIEWAKANNPSLLPHFFKMLKDRRSPVFYPQLIREEKILYNIESGLVFAESFFVAASAASVFYSIYYWF